MGRKVRIKTDTVTGWKLEIAKIATNINENKNIFIKEELLEDKGETFDFIKKLGIESMFLKN